MLNEFAITPDNPKSRWVQRLVFANSRHSESSPYGRSPKDEFALGEPLADIQHRDN
jgi:hypothetical protein